MAIDLEFPLDVFQTTIVPDNSIVGDYCLTVPGPFVPAVQGALTRLLDVNLWKRNNTDLDYALDQISTVLTILASLGDCNNMSSDLEIFSENCVLYKRQNGITEVLLDVKECSDPIEIYGPDGPQTPEEILDEDGEGWDDPGPEVDASLPDENLCAAVQSVVDYVIAESESIATLVNSGIGGLTDFLDQKGILPMFAAPLQVTWAQAISALADLGFGFVTGQLVDPVFEVEFRCALFCQIKSRGSFDPGLDIPLALENVSGFELAVTWIQILISPTVSIASELLFSGALLNRKRVMIFWNLGVDDESNDCNSCACVPFTGPFTEDIFVDTVPTVGNRTGNLSTTGNVVTVTSSGTGEFEQVNLQSDGTTETEGYITINFVAPVELTEIRLTMADTKSDGDDMEFFNDVIFVEQGGSEEKVDWNFQTGTFNTNRTYSRTFTPTNTSVRYRAIRVRMRAIAISPSVNPSGSTVLRWQFLRVVTPDEPSGITPP